MPKDFPCPACGFLTFDEPPGGYSLCAICDWEDDAVQLAHPRMQGGANSESLCEAQSKILKKYLLAVQEVNAIKRDPQWRPLTNEEAVTSKDIPTTGREYFEAVATEEPSYYWRKSSDQPEPDTVEQYAVPDSTTAG